MTAGGYQNGHKINVVVLYDFVMILKDKGQRTKDKGQRTMRRTPERLRRSGVLSQLKGQQAVSLVRYANALIKVLVRF
ncbi:TPA: hypothetical protein I7703_04745 [Vibrio vulnificus]|nr:hypothetical protein [Vibrio vulnificus]POC10746.1 hypothetical protein CRN54_08395 [Vibrio vulnificus]HAS8199255.1 hypothetical protein [Vibrio vulnificus]HAS8341332.1 hypothetical protein [Vibrio vulnificus]